MVATCRLGHHNVSRWAEPAGADFLTGHKSRSACDIMQNMSTQWVKQCIAPLHLGMATAETYSNREVTQTQ